MFLNVFSVIALKKTYDDLYNVFLNTSFSKVTELFLMTNYCKQFFIQKNIIIQIFDKFSMVNHCKREPALQRRDARMYIKGGKNGIK